jgi:hypothetical protein
MYRFYTWQGNLQREDIRRVAPVKKEEPHFGGMFGGEGGWMA